MFDTVDDLKQFIVWAQKAGLKSVKVKDIEVEFSELHRAMTEPSQSTVSSVATSLDVEEEVDEDLLFHSSRP
jgi:hypothetical protein